MDDTLERRDFETDVFAKGNHMMLFSYLFNKFKITEAGSAKLLSSKMTTIKWKLSQQPKKKLK
jgi:hypothetical protein